MSPSKTQTGQIHIRVLDMTPVGTFYGGKTRYGFHNPFPDDPEVLPDGFDDKEDAYLNAQTVFRAWQHRNPYGNLGCVLGVTLVDGKYHGVLSRYFSNT
jgi:hypothetical protein